MHGERRAWTVNEEGYGRVVLDGEPVGGLPAGVPGGLAFSPDGGGSRCTCRSPTTRPTLGRRRRPAPRRVTRSARRRAAARRLRAPGARARRELRRPRDPLPPLRPARRADALLGARRARVAGAAGAQRRAPVPRRVAGSTVAAPNVRGSTGYGRTYEHLDDVEQRLDSVADLAALARALGAERGVPVGVMGGSYGGYMTLAAITEHPTSGAAAVDIVGIANFVTFLERTGAYRRALREAEYGSLETHRDVPRVDLAAAQGRRHRHAADGHPRRQRPARAGRGGRADRRRRCASAAARSSTCATRTRGTASCGCPTGSTPTRAWRRSSSATCSRSRPAARCRRTATTRRGGIRPGRKGGESEREGEARGEGRGEGRPRGEG